MGYRAGWKIDISTGGRRLCDDVSNINGSDQVVGTLNAERNLSIFWIFSTY